MTPWGQGPLVVRRLASTFGPGNAPLAAGVGFQWEAVSVPPATPALAEGSREGRGLSRDLGSPCPSSPTAHQARSRRTGCRRRQLVTRNRDNGAPSLPCWHATQRSQPASHLALPAATIGKYPTALT